MQRLKVLVRGIITFIAETPYFTLVKEGGGAPLLHPCTRNLFPIPEHLNFWLKQEVEARKRKS